MKRSRFCVVLALAAALSGCHTMRGAPHRGGQQQPAPGESAVPPSATAPPQPESPPQDTSNSEEPNNDMAQSADANAAALAPCLPIDNTIPKIKPKPKPMPKRAPPPQPPAPQVAETPPDGIIDARVAPLPVSVMSILGKKVQSPKGDDLGRVVDVLADSGGRVRVAIIDFGGFLGVGDRKIAVDWPLLRFNPDRSDPSLLLSLSREKLKAAPEYKDDPRPKTLMVPEPAAAPAAAPAGPATAPPAPATAPPATAPPAPTAPAAAPPTAPTAPAPSPNSPPSAAPPLNDSKK
jgi:PRC-barrel domain